jgi:hypothetical protein
MVVGKSSKSLGNTETDFIPRFWVEYGLLCPLTHWGIQTHSSHGYGWSPILQTLLITVLCAMLRIAVFLPFCCLKCQSLKTQRLCSANCCPDSYHRGWTRTGSYHRYLRMRTMTSAESMGQLPCNGVTSAINLPKSKPMPVRQRAACFMFLGTSLRGILRRMLAGGCMWIHIGTYIHII